MRRHVGLLIAIAAIVLAVAMLRPRQTLQPQAGSPAPAEPGIETTRVEDAPEEEEFAEPAPAPVPPVALKKDG